MKIFKGRCVGGPLHGQHYVSRSKRMPVPIRHNNICDGAYVEDIERQPTYSTGWYLHDNNVWTWNAVS